MKYRIILIVCGCLWATAATAQIDPNPDGIGIYADVDGMVNQVELEAGVPMEVYLLLTNPSGPGTFGAWECDIVVPDNVSIWGWNISTPGAMAVSTPPGFMVAFPGIPYQTVNLLVMFIIVPQDSEPAQFFITRYTGPGGGDEPRYVDADTHELITMNPYPDGVDGVAFTVNPVVTAVASATWGEVKALYR